MVHSKALVLVSQQCPEGRDFSQPLPKDMSQSGWLKCCLEACCHCVPISSQPIGAWWHTLGRPTFPFRTCLHVAIWLIRWLVGAMGCCVHPHTGIVPLGTEAGPHILLFPRAFVLRLATLHRSPLAPRFGMSQRRLGVGTCIYAFGVFLCPAAAAVVSGRCVLTLIYQYRQTLFHTVRSL